MVYTCLFPEFLPGDHPPRGLVLLESSISPQAGDVPERRRIPGDFPKSSSPRHVAGMQCPVVSGYDPVTLLLSGLERGLPVREQVECRGSSPEGRNPGLLQPAERFPAVLG